MLTVPWANVTGLTDHADRTLGQRSLGSLGQIPMSVLENQIWSMALGPWQKEACVSTQNAQISKDHHPSAGTN